MARRRGVFTLLTTLIAIGGITLGVASLIITLGVMSGFHRDIREKILGVQPHLTIVKESGVPFFEYGRVAEEAARDPEAAATAPFIYGQILLRTRHSTSGSVIKGIDLAAENRLVNLRRIVARGGRLPEALGDRDIMIGQELAATIGAKAGDEIILMAPGSMDLVPRMEKFKLVTLFHSGMYEYDATLAYISLAAAQRLYDMENAVTGIGVSVKDWESVSAAEASLQEQLGYPYQVRSWERMNRNLFAALKLEKIMMFIILGLIILVAAFNIISNLLLLTVEKAREIGIMSALGIPRGRIARIFFFEGLIIGSSGIFMGLGLGTGICYLLSRYQFIHLPADVYYLDTLPVRIIPGDVASVIAATLLITLAASLYPAYQVTKLDPLEAIRYG